MDDEGVIGVGVIELNEIEKVLRAYLYTYLLRSIVIQPTRCRQRRLSQYQSRHFDMHVRTDERVRGDVPDLSIRTGIQTRKGRNSPISSPQFSWRASFGRSNSPSPSSCFIRNDFAPTVAGMLFRISNSSRYYSGDGGSRNG